MAPTRPVFRLAIRPTLTWEDFPKRSPCCDDAIYYVAGEQYGLCCSCEGRVKPGGNWPPKVTGT